MYDTECTVVSLSELQASGRRPVRPNGQKGVIAALTDALADAAGVDTTELPPLYDSVDPDALTQLFLQRDESADSDAIFSFRYDTWNVFVRADGRIRVCDGTEHVDPTPVFQ